MLCVSLFRALGNISVLGCMVLSELHVVFLSGIPACQGCSADARVVLMKLAPHGLCATLNVAPCIR